MSDERRTTRSVSAASEQPAATSVFEDQTAENDLNFEDFVKRSFQILGSKLDTLIAGQAALETKVNKLETKVNSNTTEISEVVKTIDFESENIKDNSKQIQDLKCQLQHREAELNKAKVTISTMASDLNSLERYTRSFNFRILGMPETVDENCVLSVQKILKDHFGITNSVIENAHRVGISKGGKPRQMIARFYSRATRRAIMTSAREKLQHSGLRFVDDLTKVDLEEKQQLKSLMDKLYRENKRPRFVNGRLYAEGKVVSREVINSFLETTPGAASSHEGEV